MLIIRRNNLVYKNLDTTILQSKTVRYILEVMDDLYVNNVTPKENTIKKTEYIFREFHKADRVRLNKIGKPINNEKSNRHLKKQGKYIIP